MKEKPARLMTDAEIAVEIFAVEQRFDEYRAGCDGKSGSPGEWLVERLDELETEKRRRLISLDGDIGRRHPRI